VSVPDVPPGTVSEPVAGKIDAFVSVVAVFDGQTVDAPAFVVDLHSVVSREYTNYELVFVDNGLDDAQLPDLRDLLETLPCIRILRLSRAFSMDTAIFAGLESAIGDYVVTMTPEVDPTFVVPELVALAMQGHDVIQGISNKPLDDGALRRLGRRVFSAYNRRYLQVDIPPRATHLTCLTRRSMNSLSNSSRSLRYLRHLIRHIGYRLTDYTYDTLHAPTRTSPLSKDVLRGIEMITSYSAHPLRFVTLLGVLSGVANLLYAVYVVIIRFTVAHVVAGWTTTSLQLSATFFIFSVILAVQAEYIGRVLAETRREPSYFLMEELESDTLIADLDRRNLSS
jgi:glycosyltransferase involved in cell wall biosynthesis